MKQEHRDLASALKAYFFDSTHGSLETSFDRLCDYERQRLMNQYDDPEDYEPTFETRIAVCKELLGDTPIYELYPEEDLRGVFEGAYDDMKYRERYYFERPVPGTYGDREIDQQNPLYKNYRETLYKRTIEDICDKHSNYIFQQLPSIEKQIIEKDVAFAEELEQPRFAQDKSPSYDDLKEEPDIVIDK